VVDPHAQRVIGAESTSGEPLGEATVLDTLANAHRRRRTPQAEPSVALTGSSPNLIELALQKHHLGGNGQPSGSTRS
jgi:hypothetical protein